MFAPVTMIVWFSSFPFGVGRLMKRFERKVVVTPWAIERTDMMNILEVVFCPIRWNVVVKLKRV